LRVGVQHFTQLGGLADFLRPISSHLSCLMRFRNGSDKGTASNVVQILEKCSEDPGNDLDMRSEKKA
jgi:hypothetical protein